MKFAADREHIALGIAIYRPEKQLEIAFPVIIPWIFVGSIGIVINFKHKEQDVKQ